MMIGLTAGLFCDIIKHYKEAQNLSVLKPDFYKEVIRVPKHLNDLPDASRFWNLEDLIPRRREKTASQAPSRTRVSPTARTSAERKSEDTVLLRSEIRGGEGITDQPLTRAVFPEREEVREVPEAVWQPTGLLLREVRVYPWKSDYTYYEKFYIHARRLHEREGREVPLVPFFSYMPQYGQMNRAQLESYLWWRTNFRRGKLLDVDYSYLLLYLYELINAGEWDDHERARDDMLRLWLSYRDRYRHLDVLVREWLVDYSLLYRLPPPTLPPTLFRELVSGCRLKEFYVGGAGVETAEEAILFFASNYDYKKSKFYREDTSALFDTVLRGSVRVALDFKHREHERGEERRDSFSTITRDTFAGAICTVRQKKHIEVDFSSFSHTHEFRYIVTDVLKYAENALRAHFGIKSRLTVYGMNGELKAALDAYLAEAIPKRHPRREAREVEVPDYERRYDLPKSLISPERAAKIERDSWETTRRLVEAFEDGTCEKKAPQITQKSIETPTYVVEETAKTVQKSAVLPANESASATAPAEAEKKQASGEADGATVKSPFAALLGALTELVVLAARGDIAAEHALARRAGQMLDAMADRVNALAADMLGDVLLEEGEGGYLLIEDYREDMIAEGILK